MTAKRKTKPAGDQTGKVVRPSAANTLEVNAQPGEHHLKTLARLALDPGVRHAELASAFANHAFGDTHKPTIMDSTEALAETMKAAENGDKRLASRMLAAQAVSLDTMFTELARRSGRNMGEYTDAADRYMRLALKAQTACRTTLEALTKLHQPREQTVKHVHVNEGGQAVVADQFHQHTGGSENGKTGEQSDATGATGESAALLSQDAEGNGVPISGGDGAEAVQDARRDQSGSA
ncbi:hypothetical protein G7A66_01485 [Altererythrobacter sp. SALINAS58]|uniref:hypothetical protein n=1 Tax=Alteripontixanthobacter muriae TaxID=2705546 RepID=UPI001575A48A|nr:hypothetical protein [Alteripontixanthobacter muriae]NTZ41779.1 hypothetical protein [Alteripontixanthobacter muriae]